MDRHVSVTFLESIVLRQVVQVVTSDDDGPLHLHLLDHSGEDTTTDRHVTSEWALLVDVCAFDRLNCNKEIEYFIMVWFYVSLL